MGALFQKKIPPIFRSEIGAISIQTNSRPTIVLSGKTLVVTYNPGRGFEGRASSRAIARALSSLLSVPQK